MNIAAHGPGYRELSRRDWAGDHMRAASMEDVKLGCLLRIADALEKVGAVLKSSEEEHAITKLELRYSEFEKRRATARVKKLESKIRKLNKERKSAEKNVG